MGKYPTPGGASAVAGINRGRIDAIPSGTTVRAGDVGVQYGYAYEKRATGIFNGVFDPSRFIRRSLPIQPRALAGSTMEAQTAWGSGGRGIPLARRPYIFPRPVPTGNDTPRTIVLPTNTVQQTYRFTFETDVTFVLPNVPWANDLQVRDCHSMTVIGGKMVPVPGVNRGGAIDAKGVVSFAWVEGVTFDMRTRPYDHDCINIAGKPRTGSTQGHAPGEVSHYGDVTRATYPLTFRINVCIMGVKGHNDVIGDHVHGDANQLQGPVGGIFVDGESVTTNYQGYQYMPAQGLHGRMVLNRIDMAGYDELGSATPYSRGIFYWFPNGGNGDENPPLVMNEVYAGPAVWPLDDPVVSRRGLPKDINDMVYPGPNFVVDATGSEGQDTGLVDPSTILRNDGTPYSRYVYWPRDGTFVTADATTDTLQVRKPDNTTGITWVNVSHDYDDGDSVTFSGDDADGHGFDTETPLYVVNGNKAAGTLQIATTVGGTPIDITSAIGSGLIVQINRTRAYVMANPYMPWQGKIIEGLKGDIPFVRDGIESGIGYVSPGSVWDVRNALIQSKGDLIAGTSAGIMGRLAAAVADGMALVSDSTQATGLAWKPRTRVGASVEASPPTGPQIIANNTVTETDIFSLALPASITAGTLIEVMAAGRLLNNSGSAVTFLFNIKLGGVTIIPSPAISFATAATPREWLMLLWLNVIDPATAQLLTAYLNEGANTAAPMSNGSGGSHGPGTAASAVNMTGGVNIGASITMGTANAQAELRLWQAVMKMTPR